MLLLGAPSSSPCSPLPATPHPIPSHSRHPMYHPRAGASICETPLIHTISVWLHKPIPPPKLSAERGLLPMVRSFPGITGDGWEVAAAPARFTTSSSHGNCGPRSRGAGTRVPPPSPDPSSLTLPWSREPCAVMNCSPPALPVPSCSSNIWFANLCNTPAKLNSSIKKATMKSQQQLKTPITTKPQAESLCYK